MGKLDKCPVYKGNKEYEYEAQGIVYPVKCIYCGGTGMVDKSLNLYR